MGTSGEKEVIQDLEGQDAGTEDSHRKEPLTLQRYLLENCYDGKAKLTFRRQYHKEDGSIHLRVEVKGLGKRPYAFRLDGDRIEVSQ